jgi:hypothetical protein
MTITSCKPECCDERSLDHLLKAAVAAQFAFGRELIGLVGRGARSVCGTTRGRKSEHCCEMPEPCWMPKPLGDITCHLSPGSKGQIRFTVANNDYKPHQVTATSAGPQASLFHFTPASVALGPKERTIVHAEFTAPNAPGRYEAVIWITVCSDHYLRWTIEVGEKNCPCCFEVSVDDTPDYVDHWYDHFYCPKPCPGIHGKG